MPTQTPNPKMGGGRWAPRVPDGLEHPIAPPAPGPGAGGAPRKGAPKQSGEGEAGYELTGPKKAEHGGAGGKREAGGS